MENKLPAVGVGKEVLTQPRREGPSGKTEQEEYRDENEAAADQRREQPLVGVAQTLEAALVPQIMGQNLHL